MKTIYMKINDEMTAQGYTLIGKCAGLMSLRNPRSNVSNLVASLLQRGYEKDRMVIIPGARAGRWKNDGYIIYVYYK